MYFKGGKLKEDILSGRKQATTRAAVEKTMSTWRARMRTKTLIRGQGNYGFNTLFAWILITGVSEPGTPTQLMTPAVIAACGCRGMSQQNYIHTYLSVRDEVKSEPRHPLFAPIARACVVHFKAFSLDGKPALSLPL